MKIGVCSSRVLLKPLNKTWMILGESVSNELMQVKIGNMYGYIDSVGQVVGQLQFDLADMVGECALGTRCAPAQSACLTGIPVRLVDVFGNVCEPLCEVK